MLENTLILSTLAFFHQLPKILMYYDLIQILLKYISIVYIIYLVHIFGQITGSTYSSLADDTVLTSNTTLYCVTENKGTPQVVWSYLNLDGIKTNLPSTTDANTGVSTIQAYTTQPGYYTCEVSQNGGSRRAYTIIMTDTHRDSGILLLSNI